MQTVIGAFRMGCGAKSVILVVGSRYHTHVLGSITRCHAYNTVSKKRSPSWKILARAWNVRISDR